MSVGGVRNRRRDLIKKGVILPGGRHPRCITSMTDAEKEEEEDTFLKGPTNESSRSGTRKEVEEEGPAKTGTWWGTGHGLGGKEKRKAQQVPCCRRR